MTARVVDLAAERLRRRRGLRPLAIPTDATCEGQKHVFRVVPGRCVCGQNEWSGSDQVRPPVLCMFDHPR